MSCISSDHHKINLQKYHVNYETGFMLKDSLRTLPVYFEPWNKLAASLPVLMERKKFREAVNKLPVLDHNKLNGHRQLRLAHLQLSLISQGYVWQNGDKDAAKVLPKGVAIPYWKISEILGIKPVMCFVDLGLANWALIDPEGPYTHENLECLYHLPDHKAGDWFCIVTFMMEFSFAKCLKSIVKILDLLGSVKDMNTGTSVPDKKTEAEIIICLREVSKATKKMEYSLSRMREHLDAKVFFNVIRPFLDGWGGNSSSLPDGLIYQGISDSPLQLIGGSGAQSLTLQVLDSLLGVQHKQDKRTYLLLVRSYMLPHHRQFVDDIEQYPYTLREFVMSSSNKVLTSCYNQCLSALTDLRNYHIQLVKMFVIIPSKKLNEGNSEHLNENGTGGTNLIPFLGGIRSDTEDKLLPEVNMSSSGWKSLALGFILTAAATAVLSFGNSNYF